jgi:hypothetical protein
MAIDADAPSFPVNHHYGLTKREYFAVTILQGMMAADHAQEYSTVNRAIKMADKLIEQLQG